jgi:ABC-type phosphate transport system permease subunit
VEGHLDDHAEGARAGVMTGVLLAFARIAGETAPLLFTALSNQFWTRPEPSRWPACRSPSSSSR